MGGDGDRVDARLARGCRCYAARAAPGIAGWAWVSTGPEWIGELELEIRPAAGEAYVWNCMVLHPHRRKGIYRSLLGHIVRQARTDGLTRLWIASIVGHPAEHADGDAGFVRVLRLTAVRGFGLRWLAIRPETDSESEVVSAARMSLHDEGGPVRRAYALRRATSRLH